MTQPLCSAAVSVIVGSRTGTSGELVKLNRVDVGDGEVTTRIADFGAAKNQPTVIEAVTLDVVRPDIRVIVDF